MIGSASFYQIISNSCSAGKSLLGCKLRTNTDTCTMIDHIHTAVIFCCISRTAIDGDSVGQCWELNGIVCNGVVCTICQPWPDGNTVISIVAKIIIANQRIVCTRAKVDAICICIADTASLYHQIGGIVTPYTYFCMLYPNILNGHCIVLAASVNYPLSSELPIV